MRKFSCFSVVLLLSLWACDLSFVDAITSADDEKDYPRQLQVHQGRALMAEEAATVTTTTTTTTQEEKLVLDPNVGFPRKVGAVASDWKPVDISKTFTVSGAADAFVSSLSMILVSEIGDETFIIAALMAMRHPRAIVLAGALSALYIMTVLSTGLGLIVPNLISRKNTNAAATVLYTFFGLRLLYISWRADPKHTPQQEMEEVEEKLEGKPEGKTRIRRILGRFLTPIFLEAFILTFLAEWGDRSQIATIALASHKNPFGVTIGACLGHTACTSLAVWGGRLLAVKISQRTVAMVGGFLFIAFAIHSHFNPPL